MSNFDAFALHAIPLNAAANGVADRIATTGENLIGTDAECVLAADVFYERDLGEAVGAWLAGLHAAGRTVLVGDPGRSYLPRERLVPLATYEVPVTRDLEDAEIKKSCVWTFR